MTDTVIPSNNSHLQHSLARLTAAETEAVDWRVILRSKDPARCDAAWLPWLAWENSISDAEGWRFAETEEAKRYLIQNYVGVHQSKGTPAVIRKLFRNLELGEVDIIERMNGQKHDGSTTRNKWYVRGQIERWAYFQIVLQTVLTVNDALFIRELIDEIVPARCRLLNLIFSSGSLRHNGKTQRNGKFSRGSA